MRRTTMLLLMLCAALAFGGSFECRGSNHGDIDDNDDDGGRVRVSTGN